MKKTEYLIIVTEYLIFESQYKVCFIRRDAENNNNNCSG